MTQQTINLGTGPNTGTGDPLYTAFTKVNADFTDLYTQVGNNIAGTYPVGAYGAKGDGVTDDTAAIRAAVAACSAAGGGIVSFAALTYFCPGGVQAASGVCMAGVGATITTDPNYQRASGTWLLGNNTGPAIFYNNTPLAPGASQLTIGQILATGLRNFSNVNMGFDGFTAAHYIGELGNPGILEGGVFSNLIAINWSLGGFIHENVVYAIFYNIRIYRPVSGARIGYQNWVSTTNYNFGNCVHEQILSGVGYVGIPSTNVRNFSFVSRAGAAHNHVCAEMVTATGGDAKIACGATSVNTATAIAITAGQAVSLPLDMPVIFSTSSSAPTQATGWGAFPLPGAPTSSTNGLAAFFVVPFMLTANLIAGATSAVLATTNSSGAVAWDGTTGSYNLTFSNGNVRTVTLTNGSSAISWTGGLTSAAWKFVTITGTGGTKDYVRVAQTMRGAPVAAGSSASGFLVRWGFPLCEFAAYDIATDPYNATVSKSLVQAADCGPCDLEGEATNLVLAQNADVNIRLNFTSGVVGAQGAAYASRVCVRNSVGTIAGNAGANSGGGISYDATGSPAFQLLGVPLATVTNDPTTVVQTPLAGLYADLDTGMNRLVLGPLGVGRGSFTPHQGQAGGTQNFTYPEQPIGQFLQAYTGGGFALSDAVSMGAVSWTGSATTFTLPNLDSTTPGTQPLNYSWIGCPAEWANCNNPGGGNLTIKTNNVNQCFNQQNTGNAGTAINTATLTPGSSLSLVAHYDIRTAVAFWFVRGNNGATFSHT